MRKESVYIVTQENLFIYFFFYIRIRIHKEQ